MNLAVLLTLVFVWHIELPGLHEIFRGAHKKKTKKKTHWYMIKLLHILWVTDTCKPGAHDLVSRKNEILLRNNFLCIRYRHACRGGVFLSLSFILLKVGTVACNYLYRPWTGSIKTSLQHFRFCCVGLSLRVLFFPVFN